MEYFKRFYKDIVFGDEEKVKVKCPFHSDTVASASINTEKGLFHCYACGEGHNEASFMAKIEDIPLQQANKVLGKAKVDSGQWEYVDKAYLWTDLEFLEEVKTKLLLTEEFIEKMNLGLSAVKGVPMLGIPVFYNGVLMDTKRYNLRKDKRLPKVVGDSGAESGLIVPYDIWKNDLTTTYIVEGEKDMLTARSMGLNAITLTGGASIKPNPLIKEELKKRDIIIVYDNDNSGREGANKLYRELKGAKSVKYVDIGDVVKEDKEDFTDAVHKYGMDLFSFLSLEIRSFREDVAIEYTTLHKALTSNILSKKLTSIVNVTAEFSDSYAFPTNASFTKVETSGSNKDVMLIGDSRSWSFNVEEMPQHLLELVEVQSTRDLVVARLKTWCKVPVKEEGVMTTISDYNTVYKVRVSDANVRLIDDEDTSQNLTMDLYTMSPLKVGTNYEVEYSIFPHPNKNQKLIAIATSSKEVGAESNFVPDPDKLVALKHTGSVKERLNYLYESAKHHIAKHLDYRIWLFTDLVFNSILMIPYGDIMRGSLDVFILGDTQVGKSETSMALTNLYNYGHFLSLKTSTTIGLIGGSKKEGDNMVNTIGAIPRQHTKLVVLEEFSGADPSFIKTMTDVRTSGRVRITRVSGELDIPCRVRMITISNPIGDDESLPKFLSTFPNGVMPIMELIKAAEDVVRYDGFLLVPKVETRFNPFSYKLTGTKIPKEVYEHKAQWTHTRKPENVIYEEGVESYIWEQAEVLNSKFESNFPLFGTTTSYKLARFSVAMASLIMNTDDNYENVIVTKDIVNEVVSFLDSLYDNTIFKLHDYKKEYDSYSRASKDDVEKLQMLYSKNAVLLDYIISVSQASIESLRTTSGLQTQEFNPVFANLIKNKFIRHIGRNVMPTMKLKRAMDKIDKSFRTDTGHITIDEKPKTLTYKLDDKEEVLYDV